MKFSNMVTSVEAHAEGCPLRVITGGFPSIPGSSISEKVQYLKENMDYMRTMLLYEPRGHSGMCAALLTSPTTPGADVGVIILEPQGYVPMCGHCIIALSTVLVETDMVHVREPTTEITLDTLAGVVQARVRVEDGRAKEVTVRNVPAFSYLRDVKLKTSRFGALSVDIAYGGMYYILVSAEDVGLTLKAGELNKIIEYGNSIREDVMKQVEIKHPIISEGEQAFFGGTAMVQFYGPPTHPEATLKNVVVMPPSSIDRSPCGTGTCARLADLHAKGKLKLNEEFVHESFIGTLFRGRIVGETQVGDYPAVIPEITGRAYITAMQQFVMDPEDPLKHGFLLS